MPCIAEATTWKDREQSRFADGTYKQIPALQILSGIIWLPEHYVHLSTKSESDMIAYTPNEQKGEADRQVSMKFGRYLKQFYGLDDKTVHEAVVALRAKLTGGTASATESESRLRFATDRATISRIFETELCACDSSNTSCMYDKFTGWKDRPYHVYADSPDVAVAYVESDDGEIVARSVVSTKTKQWVRLYAVDGCETKCHQLKGLLEENGYSHGDLEGSRLTMLPKQHGSHVLPYLDGNAQSVNETHGGYWIVVSSGEYECTNTDGSGDPSGERCSTCDELEEDCQCSYCDCCERRYADGCDECSICDECNGCMEHDGCSCSRCSECGEIISPRYRYITRCGCERCGDCGELVDGECECERCETCNELTSNCTCEVEPEVESESEHARAYLFVRLHSGEYGRYAVLASVRFAGHTFLVHKDARLTGQFSITYAPVGLGAGTYDSIQAAIDGLLARDTDLVRRAVDSSVNNLLADYMPMLSSEEGVFHV